jgi:hypothetical protein
LTTKTGRATSCKSSLAAKTGGADQTSLAANSTAGLSTSA